jgi:hypothetical protein
MRREAEHFEGRELELVYIAARLEEAKAVEAILDHEDIDYTVEVEQYRAGIIFASMRAGAFFYVPPEGAERSRQVLTQQGYQVQRGEPT